MLLKRSWKHLSGSLDTVQALDVEKLYFHIMIK